MDLKTLIVEYLTKANLMQLATVRDNKPWVCSVYFAFDDKLNLFWTSKPFRRHSQELRDNNHVAGAIVLPHQVGDKVRGIQFEGVAKELKDPKVIVSAMALYAKRLNASEEWVKSVISGIDEEICYMVSPSKFVLFDQVNFSDNPRQEYKI